MFLWCGIASAIIVILSDWRMQELIVNFYANSEYNSLFDDGEFLNLSGKLFYTFSAGCCFMKFLLPMDDMKCKTTKGPA